MVAILKCIKPFTPVMFIRAIASFILNQNHTPSPQTLAQRGENLAIFVSLASLQGRTLEDYILKTWLSEAMELVFDVVLTAEIKIQLEHQLKQRFKKGEVWLLLDGVDEMGLDSSPRALLGTIQKQLTSWLTHARVALTCRLNVWDASLNNPLSGFDTYKTQNFQSEGIDIWKRAKKSHKGKQDPKTREVKQADLDMLELSAATGEIDLKYLDESGFCMWSEPNYTYYHATPD